MRAYILWRIRRFARPAWPIFCIYIVASPALGAAEPTQPWKPLLAEGLTTMSVTYYTDGEPATGRLFMPPGYCSDTQSPGILLVVGEEESFDRATQRHGELAARIALQDFVVLLVEEAPVDALTAATAFVQGEAGVDRNRIALMGLGAAVERLRQIAGDDHRVRMVITASREPVDRQTTFRGRADWTTISDEDLEARIRAVRDRSATMPAAKPIPRSENKRPVVRLVPFPEKEEYFAALVKSLHGAIGYTVTP